MRYLSLSFILLLFSFIVVGQVFEGTIEFKQTTVVKSSPDKTMLLASPLFDRNLVYNSMYKPYTATCFVKKDSVLIEKYQESLPEPDFLIYQAGDTAILLDNTTGHIDIYHWYGRNFVHDFKKKSKTKIILGYECTLYRAQTDKERVELWVTDKLKIDKNLEAFYKYHYKGSFILEQSYYYKNSGNKLHTIATKIEQKTPVNIGTKLDDFKKKDFSEKLYAPISRNNSISPNPIKVGDTLTNLFYRDVNSFKEQAFYAFKNNGKFLLIEFWGTWCAPCLSATPKIKAFYEKNKDKLNLLSLNAKDKRYDRIKFLIEKKRMVWNQGLATEKIISILNERHAYPTMVLFNDQMEVLFIGNPGVHLPKVENIINSGQ